MPTPPYASPPLCSCVWRPASGLPPLARRRHLLLGCSRVVDDSAWRPAPSHRLGVAPGPFPCPPSPSRTPPSAIPCPRPHPCPRSRRQVGRQGRPRVRDRPDGLTPCPWAARLQPVEARSGTGSEAKPPEPGAPPCPTVPAWLREGVKPPGEPPCPKA